MEDKKDNFEYYQEQKLRKQRTCIMVLTVLLIISNVITYLFHEEVVALVNFIGMTVNKIYTWFTAEIVAKKLFNNREIAIGIIIMSVFVIILIYKKTREPFFNLIKALFCRKFIALYICMIMYVATIIFLLHFVGFWKSDLLKDTILWFIFTGVALVFRAIEKAKDINFFIKVIKDNIKIVLALEFIINFYTFSLIGELILVIILLFIEMCKSILESLPQFQNQQSKSTKKIFDFINVALLIYIILNSIFLALKDIKALETIDTLRSILLPSILSISFLVFVYGLALLVGYEQIFIRIRYGEKKERRLITYSKFKIVMICKINLKKVNSFWSTNGLRILSIRDKSDMKEIAKHTKSYRL